MIVIKNRLNSTLERREVISNVGKTALGLLFNDVTTTYYANNKLVSNI